MNLCPSPVSVHLREPLPEVIKDEHVHRAQGREPLWPTGHVFIPKVCPEEA